jgi:hypothetical protein
MAIYFDKISIIDVTVDNVDEVGVYCIKNKKSPGRHKKVAWFKNKINNGLKIKIVVDELGKQLGFIEFISSELAWRPIKARNYFFIQCIAVFGKEIKNHKIGTTLLEQCEQEARNQNKSGICTMTSDGTWMANKGLFIKNRFRIADQLGRFELMYKALDKKSPIPKLNDWTVQQEKYKGWNLIYSDQCPWHEKSVRDLVQSAESNGIKLKVTQLTTPEEAQNAPTGYGTYTLIRDGKLLADHVISKTRFENILKKEK